MPSNNQKRKAAKKKNKKPNTDNGSTSSTTPHLLQGDSDGEQFDSPVTKVENLEGGSSGYDESLTTEITQMAAEIKIDNLPNAAKQAKLAMDKAAAMILPDSVADYLSQPTESSPEKGTQEVEELDFKTPPTVPINPIDQSLDEVASELDNINKINNNNKNKNNNNTTIKEKEGSKAAEMSLEHTVMDETNSKENQLPKENEVQKLDSKSDEKDVLQDSTDGKNRHCVWNNDDRVNEQAIHEYSERQPLLASAPQPPEKSSWKSCCGIFELCSRSTSN